MLLFETYFVANMDLIKFSEFMSFILEGLEYERYSLLRYNFSSTKFILSEALLALSIVSVDSLPVS